MINNKQLKYYSKHTFLAVLSFMLSAIFAKNKLQKLSWNNRIVDYNKLLKFHNFNSYKILSFKLLEANEEELLKKIS